MNITFAFQLGFAYGLLSLLAAGFVALMVYWKYKKPVKRVVSSVIFFRLIDDKFQWFLQLPSGEEVGPFGSEKSALGYKAYLSLKQ